MKYFNDESALVIKSWCENPEDSAIEQARHLARLPFAFKQICLMPDTHMGYGMPIGGVLAADNAVVPNAVGVDIGCGMCAAKTSMPEIPIESLRRILGEIRTAIPVGFSHHDNEQDTELMPPVSDWRVLPVVWNEYDKARTQIGTLGGGNHFIEIQKGSDDHVWIMIHSGSRNIGKQVADAYNKQAIALNARYFSSVPKEWELAFFPVDSEVGQQYLSEMSYCVDFASANRRLMMERIVEIVQHVGGATCDNPIDIAHNYARMEHHFGRDIMIHRKGATSARSGEIGIIPGSQGTMSYIVEGKGNAESFTSCSHGAGRKMGRKEAQRTLSLAEEQEKLDSKGILHAIRGVRDLDEASGAYKPIDIVMQEQADLMRPTVELTPLAVIKG